MFRVYVCAALVCAVPCVSSAQVVLTKDDVIERARTQSAGVAVGRVRLAEADAAAAGAGRRQHGPVIDAAAGPRRAAGATITDVDIGLSQQFENAGQRRARIDAAVARVHRAQADAVGAVRDDVRRAVEAFVRAVAAAERVRLALDAETTSAALLTAMERRFAAGDVAAIDVNLARIEAARATAAVRVAGAGEQSALGELRLVLRLDDSAIAVRGSLDVAPLPPAGGLRDRSFERPELAALDAEARAADADVQLARSSARPDLGLRVGYEREEGDTILLGGLIVTLPAFRAAPAAVSVAAARAARARLELELTRQAGMARVDAAVATHTLRAEAAAGLAAQALPAIADTDTLAQRSYEAGELSLIDLLRIRRDAMETRLAVLDLRLDAALSRLDVDYLSGALR
jgi:cobalt-zinc-cadmium efflux system outer membrane protein